MNKYQRLWKWIEENKTGNFELSFNEIEKILGFPIDHSFLKDKKELLEFGFTVAKISMKEEFVYFEKIKEYK